MKLLLLLTLRLVERQAWPRRLQHIYLTFYLDQLTWIPGRVNSATTTLKRFRSAKPEFSRMSLARTTKARGRSEKEIFSMAEKNRKRAYGCGEIIELDDGRRAIGWHETYVDPEGKSRTRKRYETLGAVSKSHAAKTLNEKLQHSEEASSTHVPTVTFKEHAERWRRDILPTHKPSVRLGCAGVLDSHLIPRFGDRPVSDLSSMTIQEWISDLRDKKYAPKSIYNFHSVLSMVMNPAIKWYGLKCNPAHGIKLGKIKLLREKWALSPEEARQILAKLTLKPRVMVAIDITTGLRRGELEALLWSDLNESTGLLTVRQHHYEGFLDDPKTDAGKPG